MTDKNYSSLESLEQRIDLLVKRFEEQRGIIDSYIKREREWKKNKILLSKEVSFLEKKLSKEKNHEWDGYTIYEIFGRDLTLACPPEEKDQLIKAAQLLNNELDSINDKNNALIIAGLSLANKLLSSSNVESSDSDIDLSSIIEKIDLALNK